jgi:hypothetical protein
VFARFGSGSDGRVGWFRVGQLEVTTTALLVMLAALSMLVWVANIEALDPLVFDARLVRDEGELWRIVTWPFGEPLSIFSVIGLFFFWFVGHMVEDQTSRKRYAVLVATMVVIPAALVSLTAATAETGYEGGLSLLGLAFLVVIAVKDPTMPMLLGIPIWLVAAVIVGVNALTALAYQAWGALFLLLGCIAIAVIGTAAIGVLAPNQLSWVPRFKDVPGPRSRGSRRAKPARGGRGGRGGGTVTQGPWTTPSGFTPPAAGPSRLEQAELDVLLDKIGQSGIDSLSKQERQRLDELSRRMRDT